MNTERTEQGETFIDPICGMTVDPDSAAGTYEYEGTTYYFCEQAVALARYQGKEGKHYRSASARGTKRSGERVHDPVKQAGIEAVGVESHQIDQRPRVSTQSKIARFFHE